MHAYSVTPPSISTSDPSGAGLDLRLQQTATAVEGLGWTGILLPQNLEEIDPWIVAGRIASFTETLRPLIAVQPAGMPPHTAAAAAAAFALIYGRPIDFNIVAGAREDEMAVIGDSLDHGQRYARAEAWVRIVRALLHGETVDCDGEFYRYRGLSLQPCPNVLTDCRFFIAGSSAASRSVAVEVADVAVTHPTPVAEWAIGTRDLLRKAGFSGEFGIRIGVLSRESADDAWDIARSRFPQSWAADQKTKLKTISSSQWSRELAIRAVNEDQGNYDNPYWLGAFRSGHASCPFLVGNHQRVAAELTAYLQAGVEHVLFSGIEPEDLGDAGRMLALVADHN